MGLYRYVTNRTLQNKTGKKAGRIRVMVKNGSDRAEGDYECPECKFSGVINQEFKRPLTTRCGKCNVLMRLPRLKK